MKQFCFVNDVNQTEWSTISFFLLKPVIKNDKTTPSGKNNHLKQLLKEDLEEFGLKLPFFVLSV